MFPIKLGLKGITTSLGFFDPYQLNFAITYKCNSRCKTCGIWKLKPSSEMTLEEIEKFAKKIRFINWIRLTGGEPFLREDYVDIVRALNDNLDLFMLSTPTNGTMPEHVYNNVKEVLEFFSGRYVITVSLDGPKDVHDKIRGIKCWDRCIETYKMLKRLEADNKNFKVLFGYTISPYNSGRFSQTVRDIKDILPEVSVGDFHLNIFQTSDVYYHNVRKPAGKEYIPNAIRDIDYYLQSKSDFLDPMRKVESRYLRLAKKYLQSGETPISCNIFNLSCFVNPNGDVYQCTMFDWKLGNLREHDYDLKKILTSDSAKKVAKEIKKKKCPHCWTPCEAHQMIISNWMKTLKI